MNKFSFVCGMLAMAGSVFGVIDVTVLETPPQGEAITRAQIRLENSGAATAVYEESVAVVGGIENGVVLDRAVLIQGGEEAQLPAFPHPVAHAGAAMLDNHLFVLGGFQSLPALSLVEGEKREPTKELWSLDLLDFSKGWKKHETLPGAARLSPVMISFNGELHVFGGSDGTRELSDAWGFRVKPLDGTTRIGWKQLKDVPRALAAAAIYQTGQAHVALLGGEPASDQIYLYHTVTDSWVTGGQLPQPVGRGVVAVEGEQVVLLSVDAPPMALKIERAVKTLSMLDYGVLIFYFLIVAGIGTFFATRQKSSEEYALGNRNVKWWAAGISMFATGASAISLMTIPALAFRTNLVWFTPVLFMVATYFMQAYVLFPLLRRLKLTSTFEYLEQRFHPSLRFLASLQCIVFHAVGRMSIVLLLPALAISAVTGLSVTTSVVVMGFIATFYTALGGFEAVIWTDVLQGALMMFSVLLIIILAIGGLPGGWGEFVATGKEFHRFDMAIWKMDYTMPVLWMYVLATLVQQIQVVADQPTIQRVFSTPMKDVRRLTMASTICGITIAALVNFAGLAMFAYFHSKPQMLDPSMANDQVMPLYVVQAVPPGLAGLIIAGLFAASLSTLAGSMNSVATLVGEDFYRRIGKQPTDRRRLMIMKSTSILVGVFGTGLAYLMSRLEVDSLFKIWNEVIALLGGGFVGIYLLGMFTRRTSSIGAAAGAIGSIVCTVLVKQYTGLHWIFYSPFAVMACLVIGYVTSLLVPSKRTGASVGLTIFDPVVQVSAEEFE